MKDGVAKRVRARSEGDCEARLEVCQGRAAHLHHRQLRSQGGQDTEANLLHLCFKCHEWAHLHPKEANEKGLIVKSWQDPALIWVRP